MEAGFDQIEEEEFISAQIAEKEDAEELALIMQQKERKRARKQEQKRRDAIAQGLDPDNLSDSDSENSFDQY